ncbi:MAG: hypothetical protein H7Z14_16960 [Anaerolineae bacterium]|nr:hypothetical protein [Phycisphaerae bacterium]
MRIATIVAVVVILIVAIRTLIFTGPEEKYRVAHPKAGYSLIRPSDWEATIVDRSDSTGFRDAILLFPKSWIGQQPSIWVKRYGGTPDFENLKSIGFSEGTFQGQPAWVSLQTPKIHLLRTVVFQRGDAWFNAGTALPGLEGAKLGDWWRYVETIKVQASPATKSSG